MGFINRVTVRPEIEGGLTPDSFTDLVGLHIALPGLDPTWTHTLVSATVADDRDSAELTVASEPPHVPDVTATLRIVNGSPPALVRVLDRDGTELAAGPHPSPLQPGQNIAVGADHYQVVDESWPNRHPEAGAVQGDDLDWQHVTVIPVASSDPLPIQQL